MCGPVTQEVTEMTKTALIATLLSALLIATAADANPKGNNGNGNGNAQSSSGKCPPGLAKKAGVCIPPGLAKKAAKGAIADGAVLLVPVYSLKDRLPDDYVVLIDPLLYPTWLNLDFVRFGEFLYLVARKSGNVVNEIGHVSDWGWAWTDTDFGSCPPGLAKKNPPCIPPGLAKQGKGMTRVDPYGVGGHLPAGYRVLIDPRSFDDDGNTVYVRRGDTLYRIDRQNNQVLYLVGSIAELFR